MNPSEKKEDFVETFSKSLEKKEDKKETVSKSLEKRETFSKSSKEENSYDDIKWLTGC